MDTENNIDSKFRKVIIASKRAKQILNGSLKKVDVDARNPLTVALAEIDAGFIDVVSEEANELLVTAESEEVLAAVEGDLAEEDISAVVSEEQE